MAEKGRISTLCWNKIESRAVPSQWNGCHSGSLCVHNCSLKVQQWSLTPNGIHSLDLSTLKSSLLYIKHHVSEIHLDSYTFFNFFFPRAVSYSQIIYKWVGGKSASWDVPAHGESTITDTAALFGHHFSPVKWVMLRLSMQSSSM